MLRVLLGIFVLFLSISSANAFMLGSDVTEMVTAPFSMHRTNGNEAMPRVMQRAMDMFEPEAEDVDLSGYVKVIQQKVISNFKPQQVEGSPNTVILFKITKRGRIDSYKVLKPSKDELFDYAAVRAVKISEPFEYLPDEYEKDILKLQFTFTKHGISVNYF